MHPKKKNTVETLYPTQKLELSSFKRNCKAMWDCISSTGFAGAEEVGVVFEEASGPLRQEQVGGGECSERAQVYQQDRRRRWVGRRGEEV